jgi:hypothetical protein
VTQFTVAKSYRNEVDDASRKILCECSYVRNIGPVAEILTGGILADADNVIGTTVIGACVGAETGTAITRQNAIAGTPPQSSIVAAGGGELQRSPANRHVFFAACASAGQAQNLSKFDRCVDRTLTPHYVLDLRTVVSAYVVGPTLLSPERLMEVINLY